MCSTMRLIFNWFNIQRAIQYSTSHSTFNYSFNSFEPSLFLVSDTDYCLLQTWRWRRLECWLRKYRSLWRWHKPPLQCGVCLSKVSWLGSSKNWPDFSDESGWGNCGAAYCHCRSNGAFASYTQVYPETAVRILMPMTKKP